MIPVKTETTNCILKGPTPDVIDLPVTMFNLSNGRACVESCWQLSEEDLKTIIETGKIYFNIQGSIHSPILLSTESIIGGGS